MPPVQKKRPCHGEEEERGRAEGGGRLSTWVSDLQGALSLSLSFSQTRPRHFSFSVPHHTYLRATLTRSLACLPSSPWRSRVGTSQVGTTRACPLMLLFHSYSAFMLRSGFFPANQESSSAQLFSVSSCSHKGNRIITDLKKLIFSPCITSFVLPH